MLREVRSKACHPRIVPFKITTTGSAVTVNIGAGDITATRTGVGAGAIVPKVAFRRNSMMFLQNSVAAGGIGCYNTTTSSKSSFLYSMLAAGGSANEGAVQGFLYGHDNESDATVKPQRVVCSRDRTRITWGRITGASNAVAIGTSDFKCASTVTGVYVITFTDCFAQTPLVFVSSVGTTGGSVGYVSSVTATGCTVTMAPYSTGTAAVSDFFIVVIGQDTNSDAGQHRSIVQNSQRRPHVKVAEVTNTAGTLTLTQGSELFALTDNAAGDFTLTPTVAYSRPPAVVGCATTQAFKVYSSTATAVRCQTVNTSITATDVTGVTYVFMIGSEDASEY